MKIKNEHVFSADDFFCDARRWILWAKLTISDNFSRVREEGKYVCVPDYSIYGES